MSSSSVPPIQVIIQADDKTAAAFRAAADRINTLQSSTDKTTKSMAGLDSAVQQLLQPFGQLGQGAGAALSSIEANFSNLVRTVSGGGLITAVGGVAAAALAAAGALGSMAIAGGAYAQRLDLISQKTGIAVRDLQTFEAAGSTVGVGLDDIVTASRKFDQALADSGKGAAAQQSVLRALGVTSKDPKEALLEVADAFSKITDPTLKSSDAITLFGRSGLNMIPFLNLGRDGLKQFDDIVTQFGPHITKEGIERFDQWEVQSTKLSESWKNLKNEAGGLLPILSSIVSAAAVGTRAFTQFAAGGGGISGLVNAAIGDPTNPSSSNRLQDIADSLKKQDAADLLANQKEYFELVKAGGAAQLALQQKQEEIATDVAAQNFKAAAAAQAQIPALQAAVDAEKARLEYLKQQAELAAKFAGTPVAFTSQDKLDDLKAASAQMLSDAKEEEKVRNEIFDITKKYTGLDTSGVAKLSDELQKFIGGGGSKTKADVDAQAYLNTSDLYKDVALSAQEYDIELQKLHTELRRGKIDQQDYDEAIKSLAESLGGVRGGIRLFYDEFVNAPSSDALLTLNLLEEGVKGFEQNLADTLIKGKADWAGYFASLAEMILKFEANNLLQTALKGLSGTALGGFLGLGGGDSSSSIADAISQTSFATGGLVRGPGTSTSDSIPAYLSNNEFVVRGDVVRQPGMLRILDTINAGGMSAVFPRMPRFASGGLVSGGAVAAQGFSGGEPKIVVNVINQSSQPVSGSAGKPKFDGKQYVVGVVLEDFKSNGPIRQAMNGR